MNDIAASTRHREPSWGYLAAGVTGFGHQRDALECQDAFRTNFDVVGPAWARSTTSDPMIAAVSDGLSSAKHSAAGSTLAAAAAAIGDAFNEMCWNDVRSEDLSLRMIQAFRSTVAVVRSMVENFPQAAAGSHVRDFGSTLCAFIFRPPWLVTLNLGDGFIVVEREGGSLALVAAPYVDAEVAGLTPVLLSPTAESRVRIACVLDAAIAGVAMSTDGLQDVALDWQGRTPSAHAPFFGPVFSRMRDGTMTSEKATSLLRSSRIRESTDDDLTLIALASRCDATSTEPACAG